MKTLDIVLVIITITIIAWVFFLRKDFLEQHTEPFAGSDWNTAVWGQSLWNGWQYGSAPPVSAPRPEDTSHYT